VNAPSNRNILKETRLPLFSLAISPINGSPGDPEQSGTTCLLSFVWTLHGGQRIVWRNTGELLEAPT
jgi:hypothetical protein